MKRRENEALEKYKSLHENRVRLAQQEINKINEAAAAKDDFRHNYHVIRDMKARKEAERSKLMEAARNDALSTVIKAIYITALEAESLMDENIILAENMVDKWIDEQGGASKILAKTGNNTYLLSRISQIVEDAAEATVDDIQKDETDPEEKEVPDENASKEVQIAQLTAKDAEIKAQIANLKAEKKAEDEEEKESEEAAEDSEAVPDTDDKADGVESTDDSTEESKDDEKSDDSADKIDDLDMDADEPADTATDEADGDTTVDAPAEDSESKEEDNKAEESKDDEKSDDSEEKAEDDAAEEGSSDDEESTEDVEETDPELKKDEEELTDDEVDPNEDASEDDDVEDIAGEPLDAEKEEEEAEDSDSDGKIFDQLEDEEDVQKAIEIIRNRVADAEETFIKNNAEDKKKIDELLNKLSNNVKTVEDLSEKDPKKAKVAQEAALECKRKISAVYNEGTSTIFEKMSKILTENILKDKVITESYLCEGKLDVDLVMESAKVMYAFLETLNTIQIEKVDEKYIANVLKGMK